MYCRTVKVYLVFLGKITRLFLDHECLHVIIRILEDCRQINLML